MEVNNGTEKIQIAIGSDHAGYPLKEVLVDSLECDGYELHDFGSYSGDLADYPDIACAVAEAVAGGQFSMGILICGTGVGSTIVANKVKGIRAAPCFDQYTAKVARQHIDANILGLGGRVTGPGLAVEIAKAFLETEFECHHRHERRLDKIEAMDRQ